MALLNDSPEAESYPGLGCLPFVGLAMLVGSAIAWPWLLVVYIPMGILALWLNWRRQQTPAARRRASIDLRSLQRRRSKRRSTLVDSKP